jgi:4-hydroxybenzoate polyprenyltransferase
MLPCWWGVALASPQKVNIKLLVLFALGATFMRGAGCTFNDLIDRNIDIHVTRTKLRPLANKEISPGYAFLFFILQCLGGLIILGCLPQRCWPLGLIGLVLLAIYPFMKRVTHWPQLVLGFAFNLGIIFGVVAVLPYGAIQWFPVLCLYGAGIFWTLGYDTIYALQDKTDDLKIGVKSTAIYFGESIKIALSLIYSLVFVSLALVGYWENANDIFYSLLGIGFFTTLVMLYRMNPHNEGNCQKAFNANSYLGLLIWIALLTL